MASFKSNQIHEFEANWPPVMSICEDATDQIVELIKTAASKVNNHQEEKLPIYLASIKAIDLTTLSGDDTPDRVAKLCSRALKPIDDALVAELKSKFSFLDLRDVHCAAVCVYPVRVADCVNALTKLAQGSQVSMNGHSSKTIIPIASVAAGFPSGQYPLQTRLGEIEYAIKQGASEIDVVINRAAALMDDWKLIYDELVEMKKICVKGGAHLKVIIAAGELHSLSNVYRASWVSMLAGADFIKTSTGKEAVNATLPFGVIMTTAIKNFHQKFGVKIGFKPAGGIRTAQDAVEWYTLMHTELGMEWLNPNLYRIGASSLLNDILRQLHIDAFGTEPEDSS